MLERCETKFEPPERSTRNNKCFVILTTALIVTGISYSFWLKVATLTSIIWQNKLN